MRSALLVTTCLALTLAACGSTKSTSTSAPAEKLNTFDVAAPSKDAAPTGPQISYSYTLGYTLAAADLAGVQKQQLDLCAKLGPTRCVVAKTSLNKDAAGSANAETDLLVDARIAVAFQTQLDSVVTGAGGTVANRSTNAEDVTKQVIDTDAKVRAKQALADRLLGIIKTQQGKVGDLVEAEQAYAQTQEDLDAARSLQESLHRRVAMSDISISYGTTEASDTFAPIPRAFGGLGDSLAGSVAALVTFVVVAIPWVALFTLLLWGLRRIGWRWRFWRKAPPPPVP